MKHIVPIMAVATGLTLGAWTTLWADKDKEEKVNASDVPAAVQQAAQAEAKGGTIVRWEKRARTLRPLSTVTGNKQAWN